jgi:hypothetical protein
VLSKKTVSTRAREGKGVLPKKTVSTRAREGKRVCLPCSPQGKGGEEENVKVPTDNCTRACERARQSNIEPEHDVGVVRERLVQ